MSRSVFLTYRRDDAEGEAGRLHDRLESRLGKGRVFWDRGDIGPGDDFEDRIAERISGVDVVIAVVGPHWASEANLARLEDPADWVRRELEVGLRSASTKTAIALVGGAEWPPDAPLAATLEPLLTRQAWSLRSDQFERDVDYMADKLNLGSRRRWWALVSTAALAGIIVAVAIAVAAPENPPATTVPAAAGTTLPVTTSIETRTTTTIDSTGDTLPQPSTTPGIVQIEIPATSGLTEAAAMALLEGSGFEVVTSGTVSGVVSSGRIVRTNPAGETFAEQGSIVDLYVSLGPSDSCSDLAPGSTMVVGLDNASGYAEVQESGSIDGFEPALLDVVVQQMCGDRDFQFNFMNADVRFLALFSGEVDMALSFSRYQESGGLLYSTPYVLTSSGLPKVFTIVSNNPELRNDLDAALVELILSGVWLELHEEWLGAPEYTIEQMLATPLPRS